MCILVARPERARVARALAPRLEAIAILPYTTLHYAMLYYVLLDSNILCYTQHYHIIWYQILLYYIVSCIQTVAVLPRCILRAYAVYSTTATTTTTTTTTSNSNSHSHSHSHSHSNHYEHILGVRITDVEWSLLLSLLVRPISLLTLSLLILLDSNFPGNPLCTWEFHPFN